MRAFPLGVSSRWKGDRISQVRAELARLFDERIKFFSKTYSTAAEGHRNCANNKKDRSAYGSDLGNYADCEKWQRQKLDGVQIARFVRIMRLCEARPRFSNRISCCISLPGPAESFCPSQGCALTGWPCSQRRTQLGRQKSAVRQPSQKQSN